MSKAPASQPRQDMNTPVYWSYSADSVPDWWGFRTPAHLRPLLRM